MESSTFTPIKFKTLANTTLAVDSVALKTLHLEHMDIEYHKPPNISGYYMLVNHSDTSNPIRLYQSGMTKLYRLLPVAFQEASGLETSGTLQDDEIYDCGTINKYGNMTLRLVLSTFRQRAFVWLRLYVQSPENDVLPTKLGVRFSVQDDLQAIGDFISNSV